MDFKMQLSTWTKEINEALEQYIIEKQSPEGTIYKAMKYSLAAGGKRLRPVLALAVCELLCGSKHAVFPYACAIEMIHTYSLIHDDLPAMDNDDYRRGRLTNHKVFGEATAILAGDALLNYAFEIIAQDMVTDTENLLQKAQALEIIAKASGAAGMIGGQVVDMESEGTRIGPETLEYMHRCKTGALIKASVLSSAVLCKATQEEFERLQIYAEKIGLAFQIKDDILDIEGSQELLGKPVGSDSANEKSTFVTLYGLDNSKEMLCRITNEAIESLQSFGDGAGFLVSLAEYLVHRQN